MDHLGTDEQFELLTFTLVHAYTAEWSIFRFFFPGGIKKNWKLPGFFPWAALGWAVHNFFVALSLFYASSHSAIRACCCNLFCCCCVESVLVCMCMYPALVSKYYNSQLTVVAQPKVAVIATSGGNGACGILMLWELKLLGSEHTFKHTPEFLQSSFYGFSQASMGPE